MNLAILHYHLNRGGVTQVITNHLRSLDSIETGGLQRVAILYSGRHEGWSTDSLSELQQIDVSLCEIPSLDYDVETDPQPENLSRQIQSALDKVGFSPDDTILHVHNHALGKNLSLPGALQILADDGFRLLLQIHDFAEDNRPETYRSLVDALCPDSPTRLPSILYPQAEGIHYAVLNNRDYSILQQAGVNGSRLHLLPNPAYDVGPLPSRAAAREKLLERFAVPVDCRLILYPVRCIRRKNIGEALLWSSLLPEGYRVGLTLSPLNPVEQAAYRKWKDLAESLRLPCVFELGEESGLSFAENLAASDLILTTSVAEGFGMVFLECWLAGRRLIGRDLPEITSDFVDNALMFHGLNSRLNVPIDWLTMESFRSQIGSAYRRVLLAYHQPEPDEKHLLNEIDRMIDDGLIDFGILTIDLQKQVITRVHSNRADRDRLYELNPWIEEALAWNSDSATEMIAKNADAVRRRYSLEVTGRRLCDIFRTIEASCVRTTGVPLSSGEHILSSFLGLSRFHALRSEL